MDFPFRPTPIKRSKWTHHFQVWSPKLGRRLSLYSRNAVEYWAMLEAHPEVITFCELPGLVLVDKRSRIADFVQRKPEGDEFIVLDAKSLSAIEDASQLLDPLPVVEIANATLNAHRNEIDNWLQILPYVTSNARFLTSEFLSRVENGLSLPKPLVTIERDALPADPMLTRTAVFELTRRGKLMSRDLESCPLGPRTCFVHVAHANRTRHG